MKLRYLLISILMGLSLTSCGRLQSFSEVDRAFNNNRAIAELNLNLQTSDIINNNIPASPNSSKFDRSTKLPPEESAIVLGIFGFCSMCYLLVWKFRGREEANRMLRRSRRRVK